MQADNAPGVQAQAGAQPCACAPTVAPIPVPRRPAQDPAGSDVWLNGREFNSYGIRLNAEEIACLVAHAGVDSRNDLMALTNADLLACKPLRLAKRNRLGTYIAQNQ